MTWTAYLHPRFAEEVARLSRDNRFDLFTKIAEQQAETYILHDLDFCSIRHDPTELSSKTRFFRIGDAIICYNTELITGGIVYLHIAFERNDDMIVATVLDRIKDMKNADFDIMTFDAYIFSLPREENREWLELESAKSLRGLYLSQIGTALEETRAEIAALFNLPPSRLQSFETRLDFYLETLQKRLNNYGIDLTLNVACRDSNTYVLRTLSALAQLK